MTLKTYIIRNAQGKAVRKTACQEADLPNVIMSEGYTIEPATPESIEEFEESMRQRFAEATSFRVNHVDPLQTVLTALKDKGILSESDLAAAASKVKGKT